MYMQRFERNKTIHGVIILRMHEILLLLLNFPGIFICGYLPFCQKSLGS